MKSPGIESVSKQSVIEEQLTGREAISTEKAMPAQIDLVWHLTPRKIQELIYKDKENGENLPADLTPELVQVLSENNIKVKEILHDLTLRYINKYVVNGFNGFAKFCNEIADIGFIDRINKGNLTETDFMAMKEYIESHEEGGAFFESETEIEDFIIQHNLS